LTSVNYLCTIIQIFRYLYIFKYWKFPIRSNSRYSTLETSTLTIILSIRFSSYVTNYNFRETRFLWKSLPNAFNHSLINHFKLDISKPVNAVTCIKRSLFSCPVIANLRGHLSYNAILSLSQMWPLNTGWTILIYQYLIN
jgi:hypothetical protein